MYTTYLQSKRSTYGLVILSLGALLLSSCSRTHQLGMEDNPQAILDTKLNNPQEVLTPTQSISLVNHCATLGERNAESAAEKEVLMVLGNTGSGKSTTVDYLLIGFSESEQQDILARAHQAGQEFLEGIEKN